MWEASRDTRSKVPLSAPKALSLFVVYSFNRVFLLLLSYIRVLHPLLFLNSICFQKVSEKKPLPPIDHFCATSCDVWDLALISKYSYIRRSNTYFISMSFSTVFTQKTPFPPTCAILAPLPMIFGTWR